VEIFVDGEAFVIDDFKKSFRVGDDSPLWSGETDKGHFAELSCLGEAIANGGTSPIPFDEIVEASSVALHVEDQLFGRA